VREIKLFLIVIFLLSPSLSFAERKFPPLTKGLLYGEVVALWGTPSDKVEQEIKRLNVWRYSSGAEVAFKDGRVVDWKGPEGADAIVAAPTPKIEAVKGLQPSTNENNPAVVEEILSEIMKDPSTSEPSNNQPPMPGAVPPNNMIRPNEIAPPEPIS